MHRRLTLAAAALAVSLSACGATGGGPDAGECTSLVNDGAGVPESAGSGSIPTMTGGSVVDGTYVLTQRLDYSGGTCGCTTHGKLKISGGGTRIEAIIRNDTMSETRFSGAVTVSGNSMTWSFTCPSTMALTQQFTATATTLQTLDNQQQVQTYTRQP